MCCCRDVSEAASSDGSEEAEVSGGWGRDVGSGLAFHDHLQVPVQVVSSRAPSRAASELSQSRGTAFSAALAAELLSQSQPVPEPEAVRTVDLAMRATLESMGFAGPQVARALFASGNKNLDSALSWLLEHAAQDAEGAAAPLSPAVAEAASSGPSAAASASASSPAPAPPYADASSCVDADKGPDCLPSPAQSKSQSAASASVTLPSRGIDPDEGECALPYLGNPTSPSFALLLLSSSVVVDRLQ